MNLNYINTLLLQLYFSGHCRLFTFERKKKSITELQNAAKMVNQECSLYKSNILAFVSIADFCSILSFCSILFDTMTASHDISY